MNKGKLEVVKQEKARVNIDILGISELKWTRMGEFNSNDHYIYYCGQESLWRVCLESRCTSGWQGPGGLGARLSNGVVSMGFEPKADRAHSSLWKQLFSKCLELSWKQAEFKL